ncbi:MAG: hypothetical protein JWQ18_3653 [Conexibacter sp.]|nr:hypothetical protein [Conexibacter sp.]
MPFFDELPPPPAPEAHVEYRSPPWTGPPETVVLATAALDVLLARTADWAAWLGGVAVAPTGFELTLTVLGRVAALEPQAMAPRLDGAGEASPRFGVGFADGRKAVGGDRHLHERRLTGDAAKEIVLWPRGGSGGRRRWTQSFWLWPLPPPGPLTFALSWPAEGIDEVLVEVDSGPIREAAGRAVELWPDDRPLPPVGGSGWTRYV